MQRDRSDKIRALLASPYRGEVEAARAALGRVASVDDRKPDYGTPAWHSAVQEWGRTIQFCVNHLSEASPVEVKLIRNFEKYRGDPWCRDAADLLQVYRRIKEMGNGRIYLQP